MAIFLSPFDLFTCAFAEAQRNKKPFFVQKSNKHSDSFSSRSFLLNFYLFFNMSPSAGERASKVKVTDKEHKHRHRPQFFSLSLPSSRVANSVLRLHRHKM